MRQNHAWNCERGQEPALWYATGPRENPTVTREASLRSRQPLTQKSSTGQYQALDCAVLSLGRVVIFMEEGQKDCESQRWWITPNRVFHTQQADAHSNVQRLWQQAQDPPKFKPDKSPNGEEGGVNTGLTPYQEATCI